MRKKVFKLYITIIQQDATVRGQFYFTAGLLFMFWVLSTPIIRSTLTVSTASGTGHYRCSYLPPTWLSLNSATLDEGSCTDVLPVPEAVDTVNVLLMMGVESTLNM